MEVMSAHSFIGDMSCCDAQRWFLQILRSICCENCMSCNVKVDGAFPVKLDQDVSPTLKVVCFGFLFFIPDTKDHPFHVDNVKTLVLSIDYSQMEYRQEENGLVIDADTKGTRKQFKLITDAAKKITEAAGKHRFLNNNSLMRYDTTLSRPVDNDDDMCDTPGSTSPDVQIERDNMNCRSFVSEQCLRGSNE